MSSSGASWTPASPVVDRDLLRRKLAELAEYVTQVSEYRDLTVEGYRADWRTQRVIERTLQMAIEVCLDVAGSSRIASVRPAATKASSVAEMNAQV